MKNLSKNGFGLVETLVGVAVFTIIALASYNGFIQILKGIEILEIKNSAANLANELIEIIHNLPYDDVGIENGIPDGKLVAEKTYIRGDVNFDVVTSIQNIDDPFDGTFEGTPQDESPNDYKRATITISCDDCKFTGEMQFNTIISPQTLETSTQNGALFIQVLDANGDPIQSADVHIENNLEVPAIVIDDTTDIDGYLRIYDAPPGVAAYEVTVTKNGYSIDKTHDSSVQNPIPTRPHLNVLAGEVTNASFAIDELSSLTLKTLTSSCGAVSSVDFNIRGAKEIGDGIYKYDEDLTTSGSGSISLDDMEWDNYFVSLNGLNNYDIYGSNNLLPINLTPATDKFVDFVVGPHNPNSILIQVKDGATDLPLHGATVTLSDGVGEEIKITGGGFINQTDWSGGSGQDLFVDDNRFYSTDSNVDYSSVSGQVTLSTFAGDYLSDGYIESSYFDTGTTANFHNFGWSLSDQSENTSVKFQIATLDVLPEEPEVPVWTFLGPYGTESSYYTSSGENISSIHDDDQYIKYKMFLETTDSLVTPLISDVYFTYTTDCVPFGQVIFNDLDTGVYDLTIEKEGYETFFTDSLQITDEWDMFEVVMTP